MRKVANALKTQKKRELCQYNLKTVKRLCFAVEASRPKSVDSAVAPETHTCAENAAIQGQALGCLRRFVVWQKHSFFAHHPPYQALFIP